MNPDLVKKVCSGIGVVIMAYSDFLLGKRFQTENMLRLIKCRKNKQRT